MTRSALALSLLLAPASAALAQTVPAGAPVEEAVAVQITRAGLDGLGQMLPSIAPASAEIPPQSDSGGGGFCLFEYAYSLSNASVSFEFVDVSMVPRPGQLEIEAELLVSLNQSGDPFDLYFEITCTENDCPGWVRPFPVAVKLPFSMAVAVDPSSGDRYIDATLGEIVVENGLDSTHIELTGDCDTLDDVDEILGNFGLSIYDFILGIVEPFLISEIQSQAADIEVALEDALRNVRFEDQVALGDVSMDVLVEPFDIDIDPSGLQIALLGAFSAPAAECVAELDPGGSLLTDTPIPAIASLPAGSQLVVQASDELANQGLYAVWRGGLLCYEIGPDSEIDLGLPIDSSLLGVLGGEGFAEILPAESQPLGIQTDPREAPTAVYDGGNDLIVAVRELGVDLYTAIDHRQTRALGLTVEADVPVDLLFDGTTGLLRADVGLAAEDIVVIASHNELVPSASAAVEEGVAGLLDVLLDSLVGDALDGIEFGVPGFSGVGLTRLEARPSGGGDWLGVFAEVGPVAYGGSDGCSGGCGEGGDTGGGCSTSGGGALGLLIVAPLALARRRRA